MILYQKYLKYEIMLMHVVRASKLKYQGRLHQEHRHSCELCPDLVLHVAEAILSRSPL